VSIETAREWIQGAKSLAILTGAGLSAESGLPTFRGAGGYWRNHRAEDLATEDAFHRDPKLVWEWYESRRDALKMARPSIAHRCVVDLEVLAPESMLVTQNVDDLHERGGSRRVLHLHGELMVSRCTRCRVETRNRLIEQRCSCGGLYRPGVVWFGESLDAKMWDEALQFFQRADVALVVGTSGIVQPAAGLVPAAADAGARVIEVNLEGTPLTRHAHLSLLGKSSEILPRLC
jgi:NAD-dependent deacetylase